MSQKNYVLPFIFLILFAGCGGKNPYERFRQNKEVDNRYSRTKDLISLSGERSFYLTEETKFRQRASHRWEKEAKVASADEYVKYSEDFKARAVINFRTGTVRVETTVEDDPKVVLAKVIRTTLLNPMNPSSVDLFSDRDKVQKGIPFLYKKVFDQDGEPVRWSWRANRFAQYLIDTKLCVDRIETQDGTKKRYSVAFKMRQPKHYAKSSAPYREYVAYYGKKYGISQALILGIIETESHFNPFATSPIPAYGLMQIVPSSAGADAWRVVKGRKGRPSRRYLFNPKKNIELGVAYLRQLHRHYLKGIRDEKKREYCTIAAYNTGAGNVLRTFAKNRNHAVKRINAMSRSQVYRYLRARLPYRETRRYLEKVTRAQNRYY